MPDYRLIYRTRAQDYESLVSVEDYQGNLLPAIQTICPIEGLDVIELGAGTGRVTMLLLSFVNSIIATDHSAHMLRVAQQKLRRSGYTHWQLALADNAAMPLKSQTADLTITGWSLSSAISWHEGNWKKPIGNAIDNMLRLLRPSGTAIIIETMGTGSQTPHPPTAELAAYYNWLEAEHRFNSTSIRTDYQFPNLQEAERLTRFFFGDELADRVVRDNLITLPECTGLWWRTK